MKQFFLITLLSFSFVVAMDSCKGKSDAAAEGTAADTTAVMDPSMSAQQPLATGTTGSTEAHYKCPTAGCTGTGSAQGKCPVCGADLVHNPAFHNQAQPNLTPAPGEGQINATPSTQTPPGTQTPPATQTPPPAKNAAGVFHFSCSKAGCDGGAGAAGKCPKCGSDLAHNQAYHNQ